MSTSAGCGRSCTITTPVVAASKHETQRKFTAMLPGLHTGCSCTRESTAMLRVVTHCKAESSYSSSHSHMQSKRSFCALQCACAGCGGQCTQCEQLSLRDGASKPGSHSARAQNSHSSFRVSHTNPDSQAGEHSFPVQYCRATGSGHDSHTVSLCGKHGATNL